MKRINRALQMVTTGEPSDKQHTKPCVDCPWARSAVQGWLGNMSAEEWLQAAHGESKIDCHVHTNQQCAGCATYRANVCKTPRYTEILRLSVDRARCFATPTEFLEHHARVERKTRKKAVG